MQLRQYGPAAWLVDDIDDAPAWARGLEHAALRGVTEIVPAESTVLVRCERDAAPALGELLGSIEPAPSTPHGELVTIDVEYDGADLAEVAERTGLDMDGVVQCHTAARYRVAFCGFSPGFAYLGGLDPALVLPRRDRPRLRVPARSVAIAAHYSAVYPSVSPGGWHLLGTALTDVWDLAQSQPALLSPGATVSFRAVGG
jgi:5-oxoprolinase (ATP-hydrolysing) subunit B